MFDAHTMLARGEVDAFFQQGYLIARHSLLPRDARPCMRTDRAVLFIHGLFAGGPVFAPMRTHVEDECELPTHDHTYLPCHRLDDVVSRLCDKMWGIVETGATVSLVGHSLGGLLARVLVQERGFFRHVDRIVTLATPHAGTTRARFVPGPLMSALDPQGPVLRGLERSVDTLDGIRCIAIGARDDAMISPRQSACAWPGAQTHWFDDLGHNAILFDPRVRQLVLEALRDEHG